MAQICSSLTILFMAIILLTENKLAWCTHQHCPDAQLFEPCVCNDTDFITIHCGGEQPIDLNSVFDKLTKLPKQKKQFEELWITNSAITELKEDVIKDIKFETIFIDRAHSLKRIDPNAFRGGAADIKSFVLRWSENFDSMDIFTLLNNLENIETIHIGNMKITEIPDNAFKALKYLKSFSIIGQNLKQIGVNPFKLLENLKYLDIINTSISHIPDNAFHFDSSEVRVKIGLFYNQLDGNGFDANAFSHIDRPADIYYMGNIDHQNPDRIKFLAQDVFEPFLKSNDNNHIVLKFDAIDCNDCKNAWLKKSPEMAKRVWPEIKCTNQRPFKSADNFASC